MGKGHFQIGESVIEHIHPRTFEETGFENESIDFLFSHATLEHVTSPLKCIQETHRVLKKGGITAHCIDLRDHRDFNQPLGFLRESDENWAAMMKEYCRHDGSGYMNRWRASEFKNVFEREGFELLEHEAEMKVSDEVIDAELPLLDDKYRSFEQEDLMTTTLFLVARKV
jgi:ubiquinone/menaquinone biosynthesis C-methylase UbiE